MLVLQEAMLGDVLCGKHDPNPKPGPFQSGYGLFWDEA